MADFTTLKTYTAQTAESAPAASRANFVQVPGKPKQQGRPRLVELRMGGTPALGGTAAASSVLVDLWRFNEVDGTRDYIDTWTIPAADIASGRIRLPVYEAWGLWLMCGIRFPDGTAPTFTGIVQARCLE